MSSHNTSDGILVEALSTTGSFEVGDGLSTVYRSGDANAAVVWSKDEGSFRCVLCTTYFVCLREFPGCEVRSVSVVCAKNCGKKCLID